MFGSHKRKVAAKEAALVEQITDKVVDKVEANEVTVGRKGVFTPEQEALLDKLYNASGVMETVDSFVIRTIDNVLIEKLKNKLPEEYLPTLYKIIDEVMSGLENLIKDK